MAVKIPKTFVSVYALAEPDTGTVRYIGATRNPESRFRMHTKAQDKATKDWVKALRRIGFSGPKLKILETVLVQKAKMAETKWIDVYVRKAGLLNTQGISGYKHGLPPDTHFLRYSLEEIGQTIKGLAKVVGCSPQTISLANRGYVTISDELAKRIQDATRCAKHPEGIEPDSFYWPKRWKRDAA